MLNDVFNEMKRNFKNVYFRSNLKSYKTKSLNSHL